MYPELLTVDEVASRCKVSRSTVYRRIADGTLPGPIKFGALTRFSRQEIEEAIDLFYATRGGK